VLAVANLSVLSIASGLAGLSLMFAGRHKQIAFVGTFLWGFSIAVASHLWLIPIYRSGLLTP
jgi:hypothetical protein